MYPARGFPGGAGMSIPVELSDLATAMAQYRFAYLMTSSADAAPHAVAVVPILEAGALLVHGIGHRTRNNLLVRPAVGLVWPPSSEADYSLIVDGQAEIDGDALRITPTRAVKHRPAPRAEPVAPGSCGADCVELALPETERR
ncbi:MAG TPA: hypothetical protein PK177_07205 [Burkholderiaceae bacterium]|nr:hypothetical protein [Burkholderiaceae bacterium]